MTADWHSCLLDALREAIDKGWTHMTQDGQTPAELAALVIESPAQPERGPYLIMGNQIVTAQGRVWARLNRYDCKKLPQVKRRRTRPKTSSDNAGD